MKLRNMMMMALAAMTACTTNRESANTLTSGINLDNLDTTYQVGSDFYMYATGGWQKANPLTAEYSRYGSFDALQENNNVQMRSIIDSVANLENLQEGSIEQKIADLYRSAMDSVTLNTESMNDLTAFLACDGYRSEGAAQKWIEEVWPRMMRQGVEGLFSLYIGADEKDSRNNIVNLFQGGMTLGQKDYYLENDENTMRIRAAYRNYIVELAMHVGFAEDDAMYMCEDVMRIETRLAMASKSMTELRDAEANYHKFSMEEMKRDFAGINWDAYFATFGVKSGEVKEMVVGQPEAIHEVEKILSEESPEALQNIYLWHAIDMAANYIDDASRALSFDFYGKTMTGKTEDKPRWKRAVASVQGCLGEALGQIYVARYFSPEAKERMEKLVKNLQVALSERIKVQDWMSEETKKVAQDKLDAFYVKVGYPNKWRDYSSLVITKSYLNNILASNEFEIRNMIAEKLGKPVDKEEWHMTPQTVNAYYNPTTNEICFPAGILQPPFFDMNADDAFNYGAIGVVIGHEMTHGFDDQGSKYDKDGNLKQWWKAEDTERFEERIQVMRAFHDNIEVLPGLCANGSFTLGENIADHGGLMVSYQAFENALKENPLDTLDGYSPQQRFFLAYANVWGQNIRDEEIRRRVKNDPHQLGKWRVDGQMPHIDAWYEAFHITEQDPMFIPKEERVKVW